MAHKQTKKNGSAARKTRRSKVTAHYVASTHWDREWYEPFQHYRFRLVDVLDELIDLLERDPEFRTFQLDGQTCIIEDYLEIRPEMRERLELLCRQGRIQAGPWYVMPDEFLPCGESLVRNLLRGHQMAQSFGSAMKVGFCCDVFGHNSQMPQILRGFGIDSAAVWRGVNHSTHRALFNWQSPDGSTVLTYVFGDDGYGRYYLLVREVAKTPSGRLDIKRAAEMLRSLIENERERTPGDAILLFDGMDHAPIEPATTALLRKASGACAMITHGTLGEYFNAVRKQKLRLKLWRGELRDPAEKRGNALIPGVLSSRMYLKQHNARCEARLLSWAEPFAAYAALLGEPYPAAFLDQAWKYLLLNHPHDSICGCSIDQVHRDMIYRFDQCRLIGERSAQMSLRAIADRIALPELDGGEDFAVTVFNPNSDALDGVVEFPLYFPRDTENRFADWFEYEPIVGFRLFDEHGAETPYQRLDVTKVTPVKTYDRLAGYAGGKYERVRVAAKLNVPPNGWTTLTCKPTRDRTRPNGSQLVDDHTMQNEHLRVTVNPNGSIDINHRRTKQTYSGLMTYEDCADIGDGWYHGPAVNDEVLTSAGAAADIALVHDGFALTTLRVRVLMNVPERFLLDKRVMRRSKKLVPLTIQSWLTLRASSPYLEVRTEVENAARDHRLRVLFPTDTAARTFIADSPFDVIERDAKLRPDSHELYEPEVETKPQHSFIAASDGRRGLSVISTGQPEATVRDVSNRPIALTLFRGFGRTVFEVGEEGGQMLGRSEHKYWIYPLDGAPPTTELFRMGARLAGGVECVYTNKSRKDILRGESPLPPTGSWFQLGPGPLVITACKRSEDGEALIVRAFNPSDKETRQRFDFFTRVKSAHLSDLLEEPREKLVSRGKSVIAPARKRQIVTLRVQLEHVRN